MLGCGAACCPATRQRQIEIAEFELKQRVRQALMLGV